MPLFQNKDWPNHRNRPLLFIDLEMTGLDVNQHEIIEVAALVVNPPDFVVSQSYYSKVIPNHISTADPSALNIVDYSPSSWHDAISLRQVLIDLSSLAPYSILAGWSIQNEWDFLIHGLNQEKLPYFFDNHLLEVWSLAYLKFFNNSQIDRISLSNLCQHYNIGIDRHRPDSDIRATYEIFKKLISSAGPLS